MGAYKKGGERGKSEEGALKKKLILYNDNINSFDHVINSLQEVCNYDELQAEQCALITHLKGEYTIKTGTASSLEKLRKKLAEKSLTVSIDTLII